MGDRGRRVPMVGGSGHHRRRLQEVHDLVAAELGKDRAGLLPIAPALTPHERIGADAALAEPGLHELAGGRSELSSGWRPNVPDHLRRFGDRVGRSRGGRLLHSGNSGGRGGNHRHRRAGALAASTTGAGTAPPGASCTGLGEGIGDGEGDSGRGWGAGSVLGAVGGATTGPLAIGVPTGVLGPSILPPAGSPGRLGGSPGRISGEESSTSSGSRA